MPDSFVLDAVSLLPEVGEFARAAGAMLLRHAAAPAAATGATQSKSSRIDIVTAADGEVEAFLVGALCQRFPTHHFVGEEGGGQGAPADSAHFHWFIDPLDGTVNFANRIPHFCTSVALATRDREPLLAVIFDPNRDELFTATRGAGAHLNGRPLTVSTTSELIDSVVASGFPYDRASNPDNNLAEWAAMTPRIRGERRFGSAALDLAYVAAGRLDGYWESDLKTWDAMAGVLLAREAGGIVTDYAGGDRPQRLDRGRYVASNGRIHAALLAVLRSVRGTESGAG